MSYCLCKPPCDVIVTVTRMSVLGRLSLLSDLTIGVVSGGGHYFNLTLDSRVAGMVGITIQKHGYDKRF